VQCGGKVRIVTTWVQPGGKPAERRQQFRARVLPPAPRQVDSSQGARRTGACKRHCMQPTSPSATSQRQEPSMSLFSTFTRPVRDITQAVVMPFKALFVVGLCGVINAMTYNGTWWVKWVAFGMGIATVVALARGIKTLLLLALVAWAGTKIYKRYGQAARQAFEDWVARTQPDAGRVLAALHAPQAAPDTSATSATGAHPVH